MIILVFVLFGSSIVGRWIGITTSGMQEIFKYAFICAILFGISYAARENEHIRADIVIGNVSDKAKKIILKIADAIWLLFSLGLTWYSIPYIMDLASFPQRTPILQIPFWLLYVIVPVSAFLTAVRIVQIHVEDYLHQKTGRGT